VKPNREIRECRAQFHQHLRTTFAHADPKSVKDTDNLTVFFTLLGSTSAKFARKKLVKLTLDRDNLE